MPEQEKVTSKDVFMVFKYFFHSEKYGAKLQQTLLQYTNYRKGKKDTTIAKNLYDTIKSEDFFIHVARLINIYLNDPVQYEKIKPYNKHVKSLVNLYLELKSVLQEVNKKSIEINSKKTQKEISNILSGNDENSNEKTYVKQKKSPAGKDLNLIYRRYDPATFIGRRKELAQLKKELAKIPAYVAICGVRGIGKTTLIQKYLAEERTRFKHYFWVTAGDSIITSLLQAASAARHIDFNLNHYETKQAQDELFIQLLQVLNEIPGPNLLIIDNANDRFQIETFINNCMITLPHWSVLFTTNNPPVSIKKIELRALNSKEIFVMFSALYNHYKVPEQIRKESNAFLKSNKKKIQDMLEKIGRHTLLTELIAKVDIEDEALTLDHLLKIIHDYDDLSNDALNNVNVCPQTFDPAYNNLNENEKKLYNYIKVIFEKDLYKLNITQKLLLIYFALLPSDYIPLTHASLITGIELNKLHRLLLDLKSWLQFTDDGSACKMNEWYQYAVKSIFTPAKNEINNLLKRIENVLNNLGCSLHETKLRRTLEIYYDKILKELKEEK